MSLAAAAAALGLPEALVERSAQARAGETGQSVDEILAAWAGGEAMAAAPVTAAPEPVAEQVAPVADEATPVVEIEVPEPTGTAVSPQPATRAPLPTEVTPAEAARLPEVITVPTAGIKERTNFVIPKWLTALLIIAPVIALFALGGSATGACGEGTELGTDVITGDIVNCDGTQFTGGGAGGGGTDFVALGDEIYHGTAVGGVNCAGCHGANGQGSGAFPALTGVLTTFGACSDHVEWVGLGSVGFQGRGDTTYGDTGKPIGGGMPGFGSNLTPEQIAAVATFERVRFGGADTDEALADCGLLEAEGQQPPAGEEAPADGETTEPTSG